MKTGTTCTRCANAQSCPAYDSRMLYGFCQGFVEVRGGEKLSDKITSGPLVEDFDVNAGAGASGKVFGK